MGRAKGPRRSAEPVPGRGLPPELIDLQRRGGMSPDWHAMWHERGGRVPEVENPYESGWRKEFAAAFWRMNGEKDSPSKELYNAAVREAASFYDLSEEEQDNIIRGTVMGEFGRWDGERFGVGYSGAIYGEMKVIEDEDGRYQEEKMITVYREVWVPTGEVREDGSPYLERGDDEILAEVSEDEIMLAQDIAAIRQALLDEADWI